MLPYLTVTCSMWLRCTGALHCTCGYGAQALYTACWRTSGLTLLAPCTDAVAGAVDGAPKLLFKLHAHQCSPKQAAPNVCRRGCSCMLSVDSALCSISHSASLTGSCSRSRTDAAGSAVDGAAVLPGVARARLHLLPAAAVQRALARSAALPGSRHQVRCRVTCACTPRRSHQVALPRPLSSRALGLFA